MTSIASPKNRGQFQAQGQNLEESTAWHQETPLIKGDALILLNSLEKNIPAPARILRAAEFQKARTYVNNGPVDARVSKSYRVKNTRSERVDIEIITGKAFE